VSVARETGAQHVREEEQLFRDFVTARQHGLLRRAWLLTGDWASAEDLVQGALLRVWPRWSRISATGQEDAYVRKVMLNLYLSGRRRRWSHEAPTADLPEVLSLDSYADVDVRVALTRAVAALPPRQRAVVVLRFVEDLSESQTADALGCARGTVKSQTSKALATLRSDPQIANLLEERPRA
jgi:RNA polymerase sigma-70 factor (sigma-E family)